MNTTVVINAVTKRAKELVDIGFKEAVKQTDGTKRLSGAAIADLAYETAKAEISAQQKYVSSVPMSPPPSKPRNFRTEHDD